MTSTPEGAMRIRSRERANIGWSELLPRYLLVEEALGGRRVLELGIVDPRSLFRIHDAGAARVVGTSPHAPRFEPSLFRGRRIELLAMEPGRVDFDDAAFDAIIVSDLSIELAANARFLEEVRRVLSPDGFALVGFQARGRSLVELVDEEEAPPLLEPFRLEEAIRATFPEARFYRQAPFIGVAIQPEDVDPDGAGVSLEPSLAGPEPPPSHVIALAGEGAPEPEDRTLIELPFTEFEAMTEVAKARAADDLRRALIALKEVRAAAELRERSLRAIGERLPRLKAAIAARSARRPVKVIEPEPRNDKPAWAADLDSGIHAVEPVEPAAKERLHQQASEIEALQAALASKEQQLRDLDAEAGALRHQSEFHQTEAAELRDRLRSLEAELASRPTAAAAEAELQEAERRILHLERTTGAQEQRIEELREELESQVLVRHSLGTDYRDAETRIAYLTRRLEDQSLERGEAIRALNQRLFEVTEALNRSDQEKDLMRARLTELEEGASELFDGASRAERGLEVLRFDLREEQKAADEARRELEAARIEAIENGKEAGWLRRAASDRDAEIAALRVEKTAAEADLRAVNLTAAHLAKELDAVKAKSQATAYERDALATTSRMLLEERDAAAKLAKRTLEAEERARDAAISLEGAQAAIDRLERELKEALDRESSLGLKVESLRREEAKLKSEHVRYSAAAANEARRAERVEVERAALSGRVIELDQHIAELEHRLIESDRARDGTERTLQNVEQMLREAAQEAYGARRETESWQRRAGELDEALKRGEEETIDLLGARARAEAEVVEARREVVGLNGRAVFLEAELDQARAAIAELAARADRSTEVDALRAELEAAMIERRGMELALAKTLEDAAELASYMRELEIEADAKAQALEQGERERLAIEGQREAAEVAREVAEEAHAVLAAEAQALRHKLDADGLERAALLRDLDRLLEVKAALEAMLAEQARRLDSTEREREAYRAEAGVSGSDAERLRSEIEARRIETDALRGEAERLQIELDARRIEADASRAEADRLRSEIEARRSEDNAFRAEMDRLRSEVEAKRSEADALRAEVERQAREITERDRSQAALESARSGPATVAERDASEESRRLRLQLGMLERALEDARSERLFAARELDDERASVALLETLLDGARDRAGTLEHEKRSIETELEAARDDARDVRTRIESLDAELWSSRGEARALRERIDSLEADLREARRGAAVRSIVVRDEVELPRVPARELRPIVIHDELELPRVPASALRPIVIHEEVELPRVPARELRPVVVREELELPRAPARSPSLQLGSEESGIDGARIASLQDRIASLLGERKDLEATIGELEATVALTKLSHERDRTSALGDFARLSGQLDESRQDALSRVAAAEARVEVAEALAKYFEDRSNSADLKIQALEWEAADANARLHNAERRVSQLTGEVEKATKQVHEAHAVARDADKSVSEALARLDTSEQRHQEADLRFQDLMNVLAQAEAQMRAEGDRAKQAEERARAEAERATQADDRARAETERAARVEEELRTTQAKIAEAAKAGGPLPGDELRRLAARATDAEERARKTEQLAQHAQSTADAATFRAVQAEARALKSEERADRAETAWRRTDTLARQAEARHAQAETLAREMEQRSREIETRHRTADAELDRVRRELAVANQRLVELTSKGSAGNSGSSLALKARCDSLEASVAYRDGELKRMKSVAEQTAAELDQARAEVGRKLAEIRGIQQALEASKRDVASARGEIEQLRGKLAQQGDAELLSAEVEKRNQEIVRISADAAARSSEGPRLKALLQEAEQAQVQLERRIGELESAVEDGNHRIEMLKRDLAEKAERLRRFSGLPES